MEKLGRLTHIDLGKLGFDQKNGNDLQQLGILAAHMWNSSGRNVDNWCALGLRVVLGKTLASFESSLPPTSQISPWFQISWSFDFQITRPGKHTKNYGQIHHAFSGSIHYFYGQRLFSVSIKTCIGD